MTHLPGGMLSEKFGGKHSLGLGILATAVFTLITPIVVELGEAPALIAVRVLMGLCEGTTFPALNAMLAQWTPPEERSIGSLVFAGAQLGTVFANSVSGIILHYSNWWPAVFYVFGSVGLLWFLIFLVTCYNTPDSHPFISDREKNFLHEKLQAHTHKKPPSAPWRHILTSVPVWALVTAQIGHDWGFFTLVNDRSSQIHEQRTQVLNQEQRIALFFTLFDDVDFQCSYILFSRLGDHARHNVAYQRS